MFKNLFTKYKIIKLFIFFFCCVFVASGCGLKSDPEPPVTSVVN